MRHYAHDLNAAAAAFDRGAFEKDEVYCILGNYIKEVASLYEAEKFFSTKELMYHVLSPATIGELKHAIGPMRDDITVFRFAYGSLDGSSDWKRKQTYKQWVKDEQRRKQSCQLSKTAGSNISTSELSNTSSKT